MCQFLQRSVKRMCVIIKLMKDGILNLHFQIEISQIFFEKFYLVEYFSKPKIRLLAPGQFLLSKISFCLSEV